LILFTQEEKEFIIDSLNMRRNYIETHDVAISARDAKNMKQEKKIQPLNNDQMLLLIKLDQIVKKVIAK